VNLVARISNIQLVSNIVGRGDSVCKLCWPQTSGLRVWKTYSKIILASCKTDYRLPRFPFSGQPGCFLIWTLQPEIILVLYFFTLIRRRISFISNQSQQSCDSQVYIPDFRVVSWISMRSAEISHMNNNQIRPGNWASPVFPCSYKKALRPSINEIEGLFIRARSTGLARLPRSRLAILSFVKIPMCSYMRRPPDGPVRRRPRFLLLCTYECCAA